jgi:hypothetical protein
VGGRECVGMDAGEGKVPEHEPQLVAELLLQPLDGAEGHAACTGTRNRHTQPG